MVSIASVGRVHVEVETVLFQRARRREGVRSATAAGAARRELGRVSDALPWSRAAVLATGVARSAARRTAHRGTRSPRPRQRHGPRRCRSSRSGVPPELGSSGAAATVAAAPASARTRDVIAAERGAAATLKVGCHGHYSLVSIEAMAGTRRGAVAGCATRPKRAASLGSSTQVFVHRTFVRCVLRRTRGSPGYVPRPTSFDQRRRAARHLRNTMRRSAQCRRRDVDVSPCRPGRDCARAMPYEAADVS